MTETILWVVGGFFGLVFLVRSIIDAAMKINLQALEKARQNDTKNEMAVTLASLNMALNTTLQDIRVDMREARSQGATQQALEHLGRYITEMRQELNGALQEISMLTKVNTGRLASIERHVIAIHTVAVSETPNQNMMPMPFPMPGMPGMPGLPPGMGGGMWRPLGIKREDGKYKTEDGEHEADSLEELLQKLASDPQYRIDPNFKKINPNDIEQMRNMFEEHLEEEDDDEEWKKGDKDGT